VANSLVGTMITTRGFFSLLLKVFYILNFSRTGREKARVFPLPVLSYPIISLPSYMALKVSYWIGKRYSIPTFLRCS